MRVKIESTGGFAGGEQMVAKYDTDELPTEQAERIERAVDDLAKATASAGPGEIGADLPSYRVTIGDPDGDPRVFDLAGEPGKEIDGPLTCLLQGPVEPKARPSDGNGPAAHAPPSPSGL